jgi:hypothetical protein
VSPKEKKEDERSNDSTPAPLTNTWDGRITIDEESSDDDAGKILVRLVIILTCLLAKALNRLIIKLISFNV